MDVQTSGNGMLEECMNVIIIVLYSSKLLFLRYGKKFVFIFNDASMILWNSLNFLP